MTNFHAQTYTLVGGIDIFFTDSGAPPASTSYTTLIVLHGSAFNGHGFEKLHGLAHKYNLRTVIWNRRDYPGSTKYTDVELNDLSSNCKVFLDHLAIQIADFLKQYIEREKVPAVRTDRRTGGFAIMGWSMGTATALSLFSDPGLFSPELYQLLNFYVKDLVLYDPPYLALGYELPADEKAYHPWTDPDCKTPEELYQNFIFWVSSYYDHPDMSGSIHGLDYRKRTDQATVPSWTREEFERFHTESAAVRSELKMIVPPIQPTLKDLANRIWFDEELTCNVFPKMRIIHIYGTRTNWHSIWGYLEAKRHYEEHKAKGEFARPTLFFAVEGGNHFIHWDNPEELLRLVVSGIKAD